MKKVLRLLLILSLILSLAGCNKDSNETVGIRGEIKEVYVDEVSDTALSFLVEGEMEDDTTYESACISLDNNTKVYKGEEEVAIEDLVEGTTIEVVFEGPVEESYPVQGTAKTIKIIDD